METTYLEDSSYLFNILLAPPGSSAICKCPLHGKRAPATPPAYSLHTSLPSQREQLDQWHGGLGPSCAEYCGPWQVTLPFENTFPFCEMGTRVLPF